MLDTNIISDLIRNPFGRVAREIADNAEAGIVMSIISAAELRYGAARRGSDRLLQRVEEAIAIVPPLAFESPADLHYAKIRTGLEASGKPIGPNDLLIAAHASARGLILVSNNAREFSRVPGLKLENWLA